MFTALNTLWLQKQMFSDLYALTTSNFLNVFRKTKEIFRAIRSRFKSNFKSNGCWERDKPILRCFNCYVLDNIIFQSLKPNNCAEEVICQITKNPTKANLIFCKICDHLDILCIKVSVKTYDRFWSRDHDKSHSMKENQKWRYAYQWWSQ